MDQGRASVDVIASRGPTLERNTRCSFREDSSWGPSSTPRHRRGLLAANVPHSRLDLEKVTGRHLSRSPQHVPVGKSSKLPRMSSSGRHKKAHRRGDRPHRQAHTLAQSGHIYSRRSKRRFGTVSPEARQLGLTRRRGPRRTTTLSNDRLIESYRRRHKRGGRVARQGVQLHLAELQRSAAPTSQRECVRGRPDPILSSQDANSIGLVGLCHSKP